MFFNIHRLAYFNNRFPTQIDLSYRIETFAFLQTLKIFRFSAKTVLILLSCSTYSQKNNWKKGQQATLATLQYFIHRKLSDFIHKLFFVDLKCQACFAFRHFKYVLTKKRKNTFLHWLPTYLLRLQKKNTKVMNINKLVHTWVFFRLTDWLF